MTTMAMAALGGEPRRAGGERRAEETSREGCTRENGGGAHRGGRGEQQLGAEERKDLGAEEGRDHGAGVLGMLRLWDRAAFEAHR
ncbi:hypothetical protein E2562_012589 [Oryza meyeriana var. granulata]|uniref:Uncharacterized protein n=1 Tax=Oryza meyeriana var. granulata TaxID=110450 RepID=A0A6G1D3V5_9ORYZ|nr:hypothetical protein E2562_012589 [Oryza meyeriana var. granulata]